MACSAPEYAKKVGWPNHMSKGVLRPFVNAVGLLDPGRVRAGVLGHAQHRSPVDERDLRVHVAAGLRALRGRRHRRVGREGADKLSAAYAGSRPASRKSTSTRYASSSRRGTRSTCTSSPGWTWCLRSKQDTAKRLTGKTGEPHNSKLVRFLERLFRGSIDVQAEGEAADVQYELCTWRGEDMKLLGFLRNSNAWGDNPLAQ